MKQQNDWAAGRPDEYFALGWQAETASFSGQLRKARDSYEHAVQLAQQHEQKEVAAEYMAEQARVEAVFGNCDRVSGLVIKPLATRVAVSHWPRLLRHILLVATPVMRSRLWMNYPRIFPVPQSGTRSFYR